MHCDNSYEFMVDWVYFIVAWATKSCCNIYDVFIDGKCLASGMRDGSLIMFHFDHSNKELELLDSIQVIIAMNLFFIGFWQFLLCLLWFLFPVTKTNKQWKQWKLSISWKTWSLNILLPGAEPEGSYEFSSVRPCVRNAVFSELTH